MSKQILGTSLVFRLWLALSFLGALFASAALVTYILLSVNDNVQAAHQATVDKAEVVLASLARLSRDGVTASTADTSVGRSLGLRSVDFVNPRGQITTTMVDSVTPAETEIEKNLTAAAITGKRSQRPVMMANSGYHGTAVSPLDVIRGGTFAEEFVYPLSVPTSPNVSAVRFVIEYPNLTADARTLISRVAWVGLVLISASLIGIWVFLRVFVSKPLHRYSALALRIAGGEPLRMPSTGSDELAELGRALNGMADALNQQATVDSLTGLYNLRHLSSNLEALISQAKHENRPLSLIVGDLDNLKPVNDTFGHSAGDKLLQAVSDTLRSWAGAEFTCWRLGGDEFVVALPRIGGEEALGHAANLRARIGAIQLPTGSSQVRASISVGVATYPNDGETAGTLLNAADRRMYALKALRAEERRIAGSRMAAA